MLSEKDLDELHRDFTDREYMLGFRLLDELREARKLLRCTETTLRDHDCFAQECAFCGLLVWIRKVLPPAS